MSPEVAVIRTGSANLASVLAALRRLGASASVVDAPDALADARAVVLPGVGAFAAAMGVLEERGLTDAIRGHVAAGRPFLAICLGLQLLAEASEEAPGVAGLGIVPGTVRRFPTTVRVPQIGWNRVAWLDDAGPDGFGYFANSYRLEDPADGWRAAVSDHGGRFVAAIARDRQLACQFHPELSGSWGAALLAEWWRRC